MRQNTPPIDINLIPNRHIIPQHTDILQPCPLANRAIPTHNRALDPRVVLDLTARQQHAALQSDAVADDDIGADGDVGPDAAVLADSGRGVDEHVAAVDKRRRERRQFFRVFLRQRGQVEAGSRQEILGLADVHPEAVEVEGVQLAVFADGGEGLLFDGRRP